MRQRVVERASDRAYRLLRDEILEFALDPGDVIGEVDTAQRLGVSRTPLREALARLLGDGLLVSEGARGVAVAKLSRHDIVQLTELREALETQTARLAASRGDSEIFLELAHRFVELAGGLPSPAGAAHDRALTYDLAARLDRALDDAAASPALSAALAQIRLRLARVRRLAQDDPERLAQAAAEHRAIAEAVSWHEPELAANAVRVHLRRSTAHALAQLDADETPQS